MISGYFMDYSVRKNKKQDETVIDKVRYGLKGVNMYGSISKENAEWIKEILAEDACKVPERIKTVILFYLKHVSCNN